MQFMLMAWQAYKNMPVAVPATVCFPMRLQTQRANDSGYKTSEGLRN